RSPRFRLRASASSSYSSSVSKSGIARKSRFTCPPSQLANAVRASGGQEAIPAERAQATARRAGWAAVRQGIRRARAGARAPPPGPSRQMLAGEVADEPLLEEVHEPRAERRQVRHVVEAGVVPPVTGGRAVIAAAPRAAGVARLLEAHERAAIRHGDARPVLVEDG